MIAGNSTPSAGNRSRNKKNLSKKTKLREDSLDQALEDTFPASDPPAQVSQGTISNPRPQEKAGLEK